VDYDFHRLNPRSFEQLVQALAAQVLGNGIVIFGDGPDGGREASFAGAVPYPSADAPWSGNVVVQAKFRQRPHGTEQDTAWLERELKNELLTTFREDSKRIAPSHYILATNVYLSSVPNSGGKDRIDRLAGEFPLEGFRVWDGDQLRTFLDGNQDVRNAFLGYICPGDVLARLAADLERQQPQFDSSISRFLEKQLLADQYANLEQAGRVADEQIPISRVFFDPPVTSDLPDQRSRQCLSTIIELGEEQLDPQSNRLVSQSREDQGVIHTKTPQRGRVVLVGGPGQGKTTAGQFLCQLYRCELLARRAELITPEADAVIRLTQAQCDQEQIRLPRVRRIPIRVPLTDLSDYLANQPVRRSLLDYLAEMISSYCSGQVEPEVLEEWLGRHPWLLVLDGLDEVPSSSNRSEVMERIQEFWVDATRINVDLLVVATTRPQGYNQEFSPSTYRHFALTPLSPGQALHYGSRLAEARYPTNPDRQEKITSRLKRASDNDATAKLMTSPLQVTIMATLVDRGGHPPRERWRLFSEYYAVVYQREVERDTPAAEVLRSHRPSIDAIHHWVGLILQVDVERAAGDDARMSSERFAAIVRSRMESEGYEGEELDRLCEQLTEAAANRLVFLVGLEANEVGFEIRSLQEFMAANALMEGEDQQVTERLRTIAGITSWRNVFLFAAGQCFAERQYLRATIHTICGELNDTVEDALAAIVFPGSVLAADLLTDGFARNQPSFARLLASEALRLADRPSSWRRLVAAYEKGLAGTYESHLSTLVQGGVPDGCIGLLMELSSGGEPWADQLLDLAAQNRPLPVGSLLLLGAGTTKGWLAGAVRSRLSNMSLADFSRHHKQINRLELRMPPSAKALSDFIGDGWVDDQVRVPIAGFPAEAFTLGLQTTDRSISDLATVVGGSSDILAAPTLAGLRAVAVFSREPTALELSEQLEAIAREVPVSDWRTLASISPWPLSMPLACHEDAEQLLKTAQLAREGRMGTGDSWSAAERRWLQRGVTVADFSHVPEEGACFDADIATVGFPLGPVGWSVSALEHRRAIAFLIEVLGEVDSDGGREQLTGWIASLLRTTDRDLDDDAHLSAQILGLCGSESVLTSCLSPYYVAANLDWSEQLTNEERTLLSYLDEALSTSSIGAQWVRGRPFPELPVALTASWADSDGALPGVVAIGRQIDSNTELEPESAAPLRPPQALLSLKGAWSAESIERLISQLADLESSAPVWLREAIQVIEAKASDPLADQALRAVWSRIGAGPARDPTSPRVDLREEAERVAAERVDKRASGLDDPGTWRRLGFFPRPEDA
jgi:hypothetical protein